MSMIETWDLPWFGYFQEMGTYYRNFPSIHDFIDPELSASYDKAKLVKYLEKCPVATATNRTGYPCLLTGKVFFRSLCIRTDGNWYWQDDLGYYIKNHGLCLPTTMLEDIVQRNYQPPRLTQSQIDSVLEKAHASIIALAAPERKIA